MSNNLLPGASGSLDDLVEANQRLPKYVQAALMPSIEAGKSPDELFFESQDSIILNPLERRVYAMNKTGRREILLKPIEFDLLQYLMSTPGRFHSRDEIASEVGTPWVKYRIKNLRRKLGPNGKHIQSKNGFGYRFTGHGSAGSVDKAVKKIILFGNLTIDINRYEVKVGGKNLDLSPIEYTLLTTMAQSPGIVFSHESLHRVTHSNEDMPDSYRSVLKLHISRLRRKIGDDPTDPAYILTVKFRGYMFSASEGPIKSATQLQVGDLLIGVEANEVSISGKKVSVSPIEGRILSIMAKNPGRVFSNEELYKVAHPGEKIMPDSYPIIRYYIYSIRQKIGDNVSNPVYIHTKGEGYMFSAGNYPIESAMLFRVGDLLISREDHKVFANSVNGRVDISPMEFAILEAMARHPGRIFIPKELYRIAHPYVGIPDSIVLSVKGVIRRLRRKMGDNSDNPLYIKNEYGRGYALIAPVRQLLARVS